MDSYVAKVPLLLIIFLTILIDILLLLLLDRCSHTGAVGNKPGRWQVSLQYMLEAFGNWRY